MRVHKTRHELATRSLQDKLCRALAGVVANSHVRAAFESIARFEIGALDQHVHRPLVDFGVLAAHNAGQGDAFLRIGDEQHFARQIAFLPVQRGELLAFLSATDNDRRQVILPGHCRRDTGGTLFGDQMIVECVQRLPGLEHDVVRHVHHIADAAHANFLQCRAQPIGARPNLDATNDPRCVTRAKLGVTNSNGDIMINGSAGRRSYDRKRSARNPRVRDAQRPAADRTNLPRDTNQAVEVWPIGRDFQIVNDIAAGAAEVL